MAKHQQGRHELERDWGVAIADGLERAAGRKVPQPPLEVAYYGDLFLPSPPSTPTMKPADDETFDGISEPEWEDLADALRQIVSADEIADAEQRPPMGYTRVPGPVQAVMRAIDRRFGGASAILTFGVFRQVRRYLTVPQDRSMVDDRVEAAVSADFRVLIGHSLGSVVAYEYLRTHPEHPVELFLTVGSPLGASGH